MSTNVLSQLVEAESLLSEQEAALMQQIAEIQEQRQGLQTVMAMFDGSADNGQSAAAVASLEVDEEDDDDEEEEIEVAKESVAAKLSRVTKSKRSARKSKPTKAQERKTVKSTKSKKADGRTANWQRYVLDDYRQQRLQDVVANVLEAKPKGSFKITDVMSAIFEDDMPKAQFLKARNRVSNILSAGARDNEWYRGRGGTYSLSEKAVKTR